MTGRMVGTLATLALGVGILGVTYVTAQRPGAERRGFGGLPGRYVVAHALESRVLILDTSTGQVYVATERDFKRASELPRGDGRPPFMDRDKEDGRPRFFDKEKGEEKRRFDRDRRREKGKDREFKRDFPKKEGEKKKEKEDPNGTE